MDFFNGLLGPVLGGALTSTESCLESTSGADPPGFLTAEYGHPELQE